MQAIYLSKKDSFDSIEGDIKQVDESGIWVSTSSGDRHVTVPTVVSTDKRVTEFNVAANFRSGQRVSLTVRNGHEVIRYTNHTTNRSATLYAKRRVLPKVSEVLMFASYGGRLGVNLLLLLVPILNSFVALGYVIGSPIRYNGKGIVGTAVGVAVYAAMMVATFGATEHFGVAMAGLMWFFPIVGVAAGYYVIALLHLMEQAKVVGGRAASSLGSPSPQR